MKRIDAREWRWVAAVAMALLALAAVPYAVAILHPPEGYLLARTLYYGDDLSQYLAAMGDGMSSPSWLVQDHLTSEPHRPALMYTFYVLLGKMAGLPGAQPIHLFAASVVLSVVALVFAGYAFSATFVDAVGGRRAALLFLLFASGVGIWVAAATISDVSSGESVTGLAFDRAEISTFLLPFGPPHLTLALALMLFWGRGFALWAWEGRPGPLAYLLLATTGIALLNSFSLVSLVAVAASYGVLRWISAARFPVREAVAAALVAAISAPLFASSIITCGLDPVWSATYGSQNTTGSPSLLLVGLNLGMMVPLAVVGAGWVGERRDARLLLVVWALTLLALMYLPVPFQRRFGYGLQPSVALLAALGFRSLQALLRERRTPIRWRLTLLGILFTSLFGGTMLIFAGLLMAGQRVGGLGGMVFEPRSSFEASDWLARNSDGADVVLTSMETGNFLAGRIPGRVVVGHYVGTLDPRRKEALVRTFFDTSATAEDRWRIVQSERVTVLFVGQRERDLGGAALLAVDGFRLVYATGDVRIYRVEPSPSRTHTLSMSPRNASLHPPLADNSVDTRPPFSTSATPIWYLSSTSRQPGRASWTLPYSSMKLSPYMSALPSMNTLLSG